MAGNGSGSYQNADGKGTYESIPIEGEAPANGSSSKKKMLIGAVLIAIVAAFGYSFYEKAPGVAQDAAVAAAELPQSKTGKLKLFDSGGESLDCIHCYWIILY
jgi:hypothetical protein